MRQLHPSVIMVGSFAAVILLGAIVLSSPAAAAGPRVGFLDALFTATSATCVTGLTVVDTGTRYSPFGQWVVLALIQLGGLGIMTYAVFFVILLGRRMSFQDRLVIQDALHHSPTHELRRLVRYILAFTFAVEATGTLLLWALWRDEHRDALYHGLFHSVAAFCNAGFSLFPDNLMRYRDDPGVNVVIMGLIVVGGLGFLVNMELRDHLLCRLRRVRPRALSLHTKLALIVTGALLLAGFAGFLVFEWSNLLAEQGFPGKALTAAFMSVTPRTAGFNTVDYGKATAATLFFTILLMFVGGSPGSTAGGIKTTSLALMFGLLRARWRGRGRAMLFARSIPHEVMDRAVSVTLLSWVITSAALFLLALTEQGAGPFNADGPAFLALMFESVSAFGTVGLSAGVTPGLTPAGKLIVITLMFVGRLGPITVALAAGRRSERGRFRYAEENVMVG